VKKQHGVEEKNKQVVYIRSSSTVVGSMAYLKHETHSIMLNKLESCP